MIVILLTAAFQQVPAPPKNRVWTLSTGQSFSGATHERFGLRTIWNYSFVYTKDFVLQIDSENNDVLQYLKTDTQTATLVSLFNNQLYIRLPSLTKKIVSCANLKVPLTSPAKSTKEKGDQFLRQS